MRCTVKSLLALAIAVTAACGGQDKAAQTPPRGAQRVDESKAGSVAGRVVIDGPARANAPLSMAGDPFCARASAGAETFETFAVKDGGLDNVFVYVKDGLGNYYFEMPAGPVKLDQQACRYTPHVLGARVGQPIEVSNSDATMHNVHALPEINQEFNASQPLQGLSNTVSFTTPEVMVRFKCDVHPWMSAYVGVVTHPYFAVTADGGRFELKDLPAGTYTVEAWHEKLGTQTQQVTLAEKENRNVTFTFKSAAAAN